MIFAVSYKEREQHLKGFVYIAREEWPIVIFVLLSKIDDKLKNYK